MSKRKGIKADVMRQLLVRTGNQCAFPDCTEVLFTDDNVYVGNYCHINAVNELGKRYDSSLSEDYINSHENILVLCTKHHKIIDTNDQQYTVTRLKDIKREHEQKFSESVVEISEALLQDAISGYYMNLLSGMESILQGQKSMSDKIDLLLVLNKINGDNSGLDDISNKLDEIKVLREAGKFNSSIKILKAFKEKSWDSLSDEHKYKIHLNIALCYLALKEVTLASEYLLSLEEFNFEPENKWGLISIGHLYNNNLDNAEAVARKAVSNNSKDINAYSILIKCKSVGFNSYEEVIKNIPLEILDKDEIKITLAQLLENEYRFEEALSIYENLLAANNENTIHTNGIKSYAAVCLLKSISNPELTIMKQLYGDVKDKLLKSLKYLNETIDFYKSTELLESHWYLITNRGLVQKMLGRYSEAEKDFNYSLEIKKEYLTYKHLIIVNLHSDKVFSIFEEIKRIDFKDKNPFELAMLEISVLQINDRMDNAYDLLKTIPISDLKNEEKKGYYYNTLAELLITTGRFIELKEILHTIEVWPELKFAFNYYNARLSFMQKRIDDYQNYIQIAKESLIDAPSVSDRHCLIQLTFKAEDFKNCIELIQPICNKEEYTGLSKKLVYCLVNDGQHKEALSLVELYLSHGESDEFLIECISSLYDSNGDTLLAISYLGKYLDKHPNNALRIRAALYYHKIGDRINCLSSLEQITDVYNLTLAKQFTIAGLYIHSGVYEKSFELSYNTRNSNLHNKKVHENYVSIQMHERTLPKEYHFPLTISTNCYVLLENESERKEYIIVENPRFYNEIGVKEEISLALLNKKKNDQITIGSSSYKVAGIKSKYTHALHESIDLIKDRFNDSSIKVFNFKSDENKTNALNRVIDELYKNQDEPYSHYKKGHLTLGAIASLTGKNTIRCWEDIVSNRDVELITAPTLEENKRCKEVLDAECPIIFDLSSLLTILHTNNHSLIAGMKNRKIVAKSTVNIIMEELGELNRAIKNGEYLTIQKINGEYIGNKITPELIAKRINHYQSLLDFINENFEILIPSLTNDFKIKTEQDKIFGISFNESQILAKELGISICSDDFYFRRFSFLEPNSLFPFLSILNILKDSERISNREWEIEILKMIKLNYGTLPVNGSVIFSAYDADGYQIGPFVKRAVDSLLLEKDILTKSGVVSDFLKFLFTNSQLADRISITTAWMLNIYFSNSDFLLRDKLILLKMVELKFRLIPLAQNELTDIINKLYPLS